MGSPDKRSFRDQRRTRDRCLGIFPRGELPPLYPRPYCRQIASLLSLLPATSGWERAKHKREAKLGPIYKPTKGPEDWKEFLGEPELHWKTGFSAKSLAYSWEEGRGMPAEIKDALERSFGATVEPLIVIPEHKVPMPGSSAGANSHPTADPAHRLWVL